MQPPPLPKPINPSPARSNRIRPGKLYWVFAIPGLCLTILGLSFILQANYGEGVGERGIEQSLGLVVLLAGAFFLASAFIAWLLRPYHCANCQTKLHRRALSCSTCHAEFI